MPWVVHHRAISGEVLVGAIARQLPDRLCSCAWIAAGAKNKGLVYVGERGVTARQGGTNEATGIELVAGAILGRLQLDNLNRLWVVGTHKDDYVTYMATG